MTKVASVKITGDDDTEYRVYFEEDSDGIELDPGNYVVRNLNEDSTLLITADASKEVYEAVAKYEREKNGNGESK